MKRIYKILGILVIFVITFSIGCNNKEVENAKVNNSKDFSDYSINKAIEINSFENLTKETGYFRFNLVPMEGDLNECVVYAHDKYLIFDLKDSDISIVTDKSSAYIIDKNEVKEHRKLNNYDQNSFLIDKSLHDTELDISRFEDKIFHRYLSSEKNCRERFSYLNKSLPEIFHFDLNKYTGLFVSYYLYEDTYELSGYNVIGSVPDTEIQPPIVYMVAKTRKNIEEDEKNNIKYLIKLANNYKE